MTRKPKISIIGTGRMANAFGLALKNAKYEIVSVHGRNEERGKLLERKLDSYFFNDFIIPIKTDICFIAVSDNSIRRVCNRLQDFEGLVVHFSGHTPLNFSKFEDRGIFWPVHSIPEKALSTWKDIPVCIDGTSFEDIAVLKKMALDIGAHVHLLNQNQKKQAHLAAVFANNFSSHMVNLAHGILMKNKLPESLLSSILKQTGKQIMSGVKVDQTGPASRNDTKVLREQSALLKNDQIMSRIYKAISTSIDKHA
ncbi:MAG: DUF2520 domain-containing protein [Bacteroidota bacterium]